MNKVKGLYFFIGKGVFFGTLFFLIFSTNFLYSQNMDSLWAVWNDSTQQDTNRIEAMKTIAWRTTIRINFDSGFVLANQLLDFAVEKEVLNGQAVAFKTMGLSRYLNGDYNGALEYYDMGLQKAIAANDSDQQARIYNNIGVSQKALGNYNQAIQSHQKGIDIKIALNDNKGLMYSYTNKGVIYSEQDNLPMAIEYFHKGLKIAEDLNLTGQMASGYQNIGVLYLKQKNYEQALVNLLKSEKLFAELGDKRWLGPVYNNLGIVYKQLNESDKALIYYEQALQVGKETKDKVSISNVYRNLGNIYVEKGDYSEAMDNYQKFLEIKIELGDKKDISAANIDIGSLYLELNKPNEARKWCNKAYKQALEFGYLEERIQSCKCLKKAYDELGDTQKAYEFQTEYYFARDSLETLENDEEVTRQIMQYQYDKQFLKDSLAMVAERNETELIYQSNLEKERNQRNMILIIGIAFFIIAGLLFAWLIFVRRNNQKLAEKNIIIEKEKNRAEESERSKEIFFSNVSHELRTPLTLILGPLENIIEKEDNFAVKSQFKIIQRNANRLYSMINELLDLYKLESGKIKLLPVKVEIIGLVNRSVQSFESLAAQKKVDLSFLASQKECEIFADEDKLEKIINNLLSNALKFTDQYGEIKVKLNCKIDQNSVEIQVSDTGIGIDEDKIFRIFDRFYQVDDSNTRGHQGTGIGLALTKELIELHDGKIWVESEPGKGSTFKISIPMGLEKSLHPEELLEMHDDFVPSLSEVEIDNSSESLDIEMVEAKEPLSLPIVLIVEDNADMRKYIRTCLDPKQYKIIEAKDGEDGLNKAIEKVPDLIISDIMMPKMDGNEMSSKIKTDERTSHIPIVVLTARASLEQKIIGIETGADAYISKPFNAKELQAWVKKLIEQRKKLRESFMRSFKPGLQLTSENITNIDQQFIQKAIGMVETYIADSEFTVEKFGQEMAMSRVQLHRKLKALTDQSASQFVRTIRLKKAADSLLNNHVNIKETAYKYGFNNLSYFDKCFLKEFGMTPSEYIANNKS